MYNAYIEKTEAGLVHTYNRAPVVIDRGEGPYLYDVEGKRYLDYVGGIAVCGLGYGNRELNDALKAQIDRITHTSNLYYNTTCGDAAEALRAISGMDRVFFTNSGTEAIEGAMKSARKYAWRLGTGRYEFIAFENSFHGRSIGATSVTGTEKFRTPFEPLLPGVRFAKFNDLDSVKALVNDKTLAILVEPIQGEGGIWAATPEFLQGLRALCDAEGILLIFDEIQCGMGRTGDYFAWQGYGVKPDLMTMAKGIGSGIPVGAFAMTEAVAAHSLEAGDHGSTYGGNPFACAGVLKTIEIFKREDIPGHAREIGAYLAERLDALMTRDDRIKARRGVGLIQGIEVARPAGEIVDAARARGLLLVSAKGNVIRLVPPLIIEKQQVDELIGILEDIL